MREFVYIWLILLAGMLLSLPLLRFLKKRYFPAWTMKPETINELNGVKWLLTLVLYMCTAVLVLYTLIQWYVFPRMLGS